MLSTSDRICAVRGLSHQSGSQAFHATVAEPVRREGSTNSDRTDPSHLLYELCQCSLVEPVQTRGDLSTGLEVFPRMVGAALRAFRQPRDDAVKEWDGVQSDVQGDVSCPVLLCPHLEAKKMLATPGNGRLCCRVKRVPAVLSCTY